MTEPHPKFLKAIIAVQNKKDAAHVHTYLQELLDSFISEVVAKSPDAQALYATIEKMQSLDDAILIFLRYEFYNVPEDHVVMFRIFFDEDFYKEVTGLPAADIPVLTFCTTIHPFERLIQTHASLDIISHFLSTVNESASALVFYPLSILVCYLKHIAPYASADIKGEFLDGPVRQFILTTQQCTHDVTLHIGFIQETIERISAHTKEA